MQAAINNIQLEFVDLCVPSHYIRMCSITEHHNHAINKIFSGQRFELYH